MKLLVFRIWFLLVPYVYILFSCQPIWANDCKDTIAPSFSEQQSVDARNLVVELATLNQRNTNEAGLSLHKDALLGELKRLVGLAENIFDEQGKYLEKEMIDKYATEVEEIQQVRRLTRDPYYSLVEIESRRVYFKNGRVLWVADGTAVDSKGASYSYREKMRNAIFVMDKKGNVFVSLYHDPLEAWHSSLTRAGPVAFAGTMVIEDGYIKYVSNITGHYRSSIFDFAQLLNLLSSKLAYEHSIKIRLVADSKNSFTMEVKPSSLTNDKPFLGKLRNFFGR